jgi:hypothetical protein
LVFDVSNALAVLVALGLQASGCFFSSSTLVRLLDLVFTFPSSFAMAITYVVKAFVFVPIHL